MHLHNVKFAAAGNEEEGYQITQTFVEEMIETFRKEKRLHRRFAFQIIRDVSHHRLLCSKTLVVDITNETVSSSQRSAGSL